MLQSFKCLRASIMRPSGIYNPIRGFASSLVSRQEALAPAPAPITPSSPEKKTMDYRELAKRLAENSSPENVVNPTSGNQELIHKYILHLNFKRNNTHATLTAVTEDLRFQTLNPQLSFNEKVLYYYQLPEIVKLSLSGGNVGFRKSARGEYEAGFQVVAKMFTLMEQKGYLNKKVEVVLKEFGKGRDAFFDALRGKEGDKIRDKITRFTDDTKLKFGGTRSPKRRRL